MLYTFLIPNLVREKSKYPEGAKISSENKSARGEDTGRMEVDAMK